MFGVEFRYFLNSLCQNQILFECFGARSTLFRNVCLQIQYFSNNICIISILFECSELKSDTFPMFRVEIPYFLNVWAKKHTFGIVWFQIRYFWAFFFTITIFFKHFAYVVNTSQMFWAEIKYFLNLLVQKSHYFRMFCVT